MSKTKASKLFTDLAPSDSCFFGKLKAVLKGSSLQDTDELLPDMTWVLGNISLQELETVSENGSSDSTDASREADILRLKDWVEQRINTRFALADAMPHFLEHPLF
jgi:hypothetical protein